METRSSQHREDAAVPLFDFDPLNQMCRSTEVHRLQLPIFLPALPLFL
jgi:hypothetical protein